MIPVFIAAGIGLTMLGLVLNPAKKAASPPSSTETPPRSETPPKGEETPPAT